jgi:hypothetical protein
MSWYYAENNEQKGPVEQTEFEQLARQGRITSETLVWREGMAEWQPYAKVAPSGFGTPLGMAAQPDIKCSSCGKVFPTDQVIRLGSGYVCAACKPIAVQKLSEGATTNEAEKVRQEHISHEASIKSVGFLYLLSSAIMVVSSVGLIAASTTVKSGEFLGTGVGFLVLAALLITVGIGLRKLKRWARIPAIIISVLGLFAIGFGTLINGYILYLLACKKGVMVFSEEYQHIIAETPHIKYRTSIIVWILLAFVILALGAALIFPFLKTGR